MSLALELLLHHGGAPVCRMAALAGDKFSLQGHDYVMGLPVLAPGWLDRRCSH